ncbi:hypothetical protein Aph01nite_32500 [Acrocarpospora phusangensis]|uniref:Uncharacterized protein n=1 Tax=Acrocarpospora phusangensis TaxID=1070424 RepID=A0A919QE73_9ACTN|nr:hypothetical protein Aph01nite_32500 [Acrocarpospora phusangensis]
MAGTRASSAKASPSYHGSAYGVANSQAATQASETAAASWPSRRTSPQASPTSRSSDAIWIQIRYAPGPNSPCRPYWTSFQGVAQEIDLLALRIWSNACGPASAYARPAVAVATPASRASLGRLRRDSQAGPRATRPTVTLTATPRPSRMPRRTGGVTARAAIMKTMARVSTCMPADRW